MRVNAFVCPPGPPRLRAGGRAPRRKPPKTRPLYGVCQGGRNGPANSSCFLAFFLASFLACFLVRRDVSSSRRHFLPYFASSTDLLVDSVLRRGQLVVEAIG